MKPGFAYSYYYNIITIWGWVTRAVGAVGYRIRRQIITVERRLNE